MRYKYPSQIRRERLRALQRNTTRKNYREEYDQKTDDELNESITNSPTAAERRRALSALARRIVSNTRNNKPRY